MVKIRHLGRLLLGLVTLFAIGSIPASATFKAISSIGTAISNSEIASTITANGTDKCYIIRRANDGGTGAGYGLYYNGSNFSMANITIGSESSYSYVVKIGGDATNGYTFHFISSNVYITSGNTENSIGTTSDSNTDDAKFTITAFTGSNDGSPKTGDTYVAISGKVNSSYGFNSQGTTFCTWDADKGQQAAYEIVPVEVSDYYTITYNLTINSSAYKTITSSCKSGDNVANLSVDFVTFTQPSIVGTAISSDQTVTVDCTENLPFKVSDNSNTYWYMLDMHSTDSGMKGTYGHTQGKASYFWYYDDSNGATLRCEDYASNSTYSTDDEARYLWKVTGSLVNGFKFYNKKLGDTYTLHKAATGSVAAEMTTDASNNTFDLYASTAGVTNGVCFMLKADGETNYLNKQATTDKGLKLLGWTAPDGGSTIIFRPVSFRAQSYYTNVVATCNDDIYANAPTGALGLRTSAAIDYSSATTAYNASTAAVFDDTKTSSLVSANTTVATSIANISYNTVPADLTGFYRLVSAEHNKTLSVKTVIDGYSISYPLSGTLSDNEALSDATSIVQFVKNTDGYYSLQINGQYFGTTRQSAATVFPANAAGQYYSVTNYNHGKFNLKNTSGGDYAYLHCSAGQASGIVGWTADAGASLWYIVPATELDVPLTTVSEASYATTYLPFDVSGVTDAKAYSGSLDETAKTLTATEITTIPATTGVILKSDNKAEKAKLTIGTASAISGTNSLTGTLTSIAITDDNRANYLVFGRKNVSDGSTVTEPGFYQYTGTTIPANRAYLDNSTSAGAIRLVFDGETTGIDAATIFGGEQTNAPVYDLSGRRVVTPVKGGIYLQGGKKFIK